MCQAGWLSGILHTVQKNVNIDLKLHPWKDLCARLALDNIWKLGFEGISTQQLTAKSGSLCLDSLCQQYGLF